MEFRIGVPFPELFGELSEDGVLREFGRDAIATVPSEPGIYVWMIVQDRWDEEGGDLRCSRFLYVGQANSLDRRVKEYCRYFKSARASHQAIDATLTAPVPRYSVIDRKPNTAERVGWKLYEITRETDVYYDDHVPPGEPPVELNRHIPSTITLSLVRDREIRKALDESVHNSIDPYDLWDRVLLESLVLWDQINSRRNEYLEIGNAWHYADVGVPDGAETGERWRS